MKSSATDRVYNKGLSALDLVRQDLVSRGDNSKDVRERAKEAVRKAFLAAERAKLELESSLQAD